MAMGTATVEAQAVMSHHRVDILNGVVLPMNGAHHLEAAKSTVSQLCPRLLVLLGRAPEGAIGAELVAREVFAARGHYETPSFEEEFSRVDISANVGHHQCVQQVNISDESRLIDNGGK